VLAALQARGLPAQLSSSAGAENAEQEDEVALWKRRFLISLAFAVPVFVIGMGLMHSHLLEEPRHWLEAEAVTGVPRYALIMAALSTPVQLWLSAPFYRAAYKALRHGAATMDLLISLGTSVAYGYSLLSTLLAAWNPTRFSGARADFFDTSVFLITFILLGRWLEKAAKRRTSAALRQLLELRPREALLLEEGEPERAVPIELIEAGDCLRVLPGARIPADGVVLEGHSAADESMLTGEHLPVEKVPGSPLVGGSLNSGGGMLIMRATRVGRETALAQIVSLVEAAQTAKPPIQALADRVAAAFVPVIVLLALIVFLVWAVVALTRPDWLPKGQPPLVSALSFAISVLVVACPCSLGLATPTALMVGTGKFFFFFPTCIYVRGGLRS
jgi:Cu+-exporting ATPase